MVRGVMTRTLHYQFRQLRKSRNSATWFDLRETSTKKHLPFLRGCTVARAAISNACSE
jgi:hypothetical protein